MHAERTFWEKATLAHVYCREGKVRGALGFARHWHDLVRLEQAGVADRALADRGLALAVAEHKTKFFPATDADGHAIDYVAAVQSALQLGPDGEALAQLATDYAEMVAAGYLERQAEPFEVLMASVATLQIRANAHTS
jgi:hypothetical protein